MATAPKNSQKSIHNETITDSFHLLHLHSKMYGLNSFHPPAAYNIHQTISHEYSDIFQIIFMIILYAYSFHLTWTFDAFLKIGSSSIIINYASRFFVLVRVYICIYSKKIWKIIENFGAIDQRLVSNEIGAIITYNRKRNTIIAMALSFVFKMSGFFMTVFLFDNYGVRKFMEMTPMYFSWTIINGCYECSICIYLFVCWSSYVRLNFINKCLR